MGPPQAAHTRQKLFEPITICPLVTLCDHDERHASPASVHETVHEQTPDVTYNRRWGGWDSNPRPTDYEKHGFVHPCPLAARMALNMALTALVALGLSGLPFHE